MESDEATRQLAEANRVQNAVRAVLPRDYAVAMGWAMFELFMIPPFGWGWISQPVWAAVVIVVGGLGWYVTYRYFARRLVHREPPLPNWTWGVLGGWGGIASATAAMSYPSFAQAFLVAGVAAAVPYCVAAGYLFQIDHR